MSDYTDEALATIHAAYPAIEKQVRAAISAAIAAREFAVASGKLTREGGRGQ